MRAPSPTSPSARPLARCPARFPATRLSALALGLCAGLFAANDAPASALAQESLESLLTRGRAAHAAAVEAARPRVEAHLQELLVAGSLTRAGRPHPAVQALDQLGSPVAFVLLEVLAAPEAPPDSPEARRVALAHQLLAERVSEPLVPLLLERSRSGSSASRRRVIELLALAPEATVVLPTLWELFEEGPEGLRPTALVALVRVDVTSARQVVGRVLSGDGEAGLARRALEELALGSRADLADLVAAHVSGANPRAPLAVWIGRYYDAVPEALTPQRALALAEWMASGRLPAAETRSLLEVLGRLRPALGRDLAAILARIEANSDAELSEAASICLARLGDRQARRMLERRYTERIDRAPDSFELIADRARLYLRLGDPSASARDWRRALDLTANRPVTLQRDLWIGLARAHVLEGRLPLAATALEKAELSPLRRRQLRSDPDFAALVEHSRHGRVLGD